MWVSLGVGISSSLIATAIYLWIAERRLIPALIVAATGLAGFLITWFFSKKKASSDNPRPDIATSVQVNPQFNPQFNPTIQIGVNSSAEDERRERRRNEETVLAFMRTEKKSLVETVASGTGLTKKQAADALESLYFQRFLFRSPIQASGDFIYWLSDL